MKGSILLRIGIVMMVVIMLILIYLFYLGCVEFLNTCPEGSQCPEWFWKTFR